MSADRIDHRSLLADEEVARAMEHQAALLLGRLCALLCPQAVGSDRTTTPAHALNRK
jgi:hypothetical protein